MFRVTGSWPPAGTRLGYHGPILLFNPSPWWGSINSIVTLQTGAGGSKGLRSVNYPGSSDPSLCFSHDVMLPHRGWEASKETLSEAPIRGRHNLFKVILLMLVIRASRGNKTSYEVTSPTPRPGQEPPLGSHNLPGFLPSQHGVALANPNVCKPD